ncbi:zinc-dependent alcohol dehydrogenase [Phytoactinopolyspora mesophila]|uniref:Zinc-binding dehydrogenase n=1 Tax=Phytoactinopolyspora mesophila TaxID=2650750 RepID=A0A7K3MD13_9ACTN|nr:zinc-binding alcohol dehydrogenase [Phytoactinopolyspora mesophila]NDL61096.1 zinc-binding dehydrogenase [Phytoactinopolyspora mesophila]
MSIPNASRTKRTRESDIPDSAPALIVEDVEKVTLGQRTVREPGPSQALIKTEYSGVSVGTELRAATGRPTQIFGPMPYVPGYQAVGRVMAVGEQAASADFQVGDTVACVTSGTHQRYFVSDISGLHRIEPNDRLPTAALFAQPAVGANALNMACLKTGDVILILGQGLIGQAMAQLARLRGAYVIGTDVVPKRLELSAAHCVDWAVDANEGPVSAQIADRHALGVDVVAEATGTGGASLVDDAVECLGKGGTFAQVGATHELRLELRLTPLAEKGIRVLVPGGVGDRRCQAGVLRLLMSGALNLHPLISDFVPWQKSAAIYSQLFASQRDGLNGVVIDWRERPGD